MRREKVARFLGRAGVKYPSGKPGRILPADLLSWRSSFWEDRDGCLSGCGAAEGLATGTRLYHFTKRVVRRSPPVLGGGSDHITD
jgi:hypothetical protein